jgi:hypothetical protein
MFEENAMSVKGNILTIKEDIKGIKEFFLLSGNQDRFIEDDDTNKKLEVILESVNFKSVLNGEIDIEIYDSYINVEASQASISISLHSNGKATIHFYKDTNHKIYLKTDLYHKFIDKFIHYKIKQANNVLDEFTKFLN